MGRVHGEFILNKIQLNHFRLRLLNKKNVK